jgi:hypothetical protein
MATHKQSGCTETRTNKEMTMKNHVERLKTMFSKDYSEANIKNPSYRISTPDPMGNLITKEATVETLDMHIEQRTKELQTKTVK